MEGAKEGRPGGHGGGGEALPQGQVSSSPLLRGSAKPPATLPGRISAAPALLPANRLFTCLACPEGKGRL